MTQNSITDRTMSAIKEELKTTGLCPVCQCNKPHKDISYFKETTYKLAGLSDDQRKILNETGYWVCGNTECLEDDGSRTKLAEIEAVGHGITLKGYKQAINVEFETLRNKCVGHRHKPCGYENILGIETKTKSGSDVW